jgi:hypothetical protein
VSGATVSRSWTRLNPVPAADPLDEAIARTHVYADSVPRIGFCAPDTEWLDAAGSPVAGIDLTPFRVRAWRIRPASAAAGPRSALELAPVLISGGTLADRGSLYGPPLERSMRRADPAIETTWQIGTYVFRIERAGPGPAGRSVAWFAVELRGPWIGPEEESTPVPGAPEPAPEVPAPATP